GTGYLLTLDLPEGVVITSAAGLTAPSIAEFVMARVLAHWKRLDAVAVLQREHVWKPDEGRGRTVAGSTMVVVGLGAIGGEVAQRASAFGMRVLGVRRTPAPHPHAELVVGPDELSRA